MQFITDVKPGECEILTPSLVHKPLLAVGCLNGAHVLMQLTPPPAGRTHDGLSVLDHLLLDLDILEYSLLLLKISSSDFAHIFQVPTIGFPSLSFTYCA